MPELLVFFGAGASKAFANIPTMKEMVSLFEREIKAENEMTQLYSSVVEALKDAHPERVDLEAVFSVLNGIATGRTLKDLGFLATYEAKRLGISPTSTTSPETQALAGKLVKKYEEFVASKCEIDESAKTSLVDLYARLTEILPGGVKQPVPYQDKRIFWSPTWAFYTTNYDLCIETVCSDAGIEIQRGSYFDNRLNRRVIRPEQSNLGMDVFKIVKLHGSVSWFRRKDGLELENPEGVPSRETLQGRIMLYPLEEKAMYEEPYILLINYFRQDLKKAARWLFIGYRFNDPFLLRIIEYCSQPSKRIGVVHPEATNLVNAKLQDVSGSKTGFDAKLDDLLLANSSSSGVFRNWMTS